MQKNTLIEWNARLTFGINLIDSQHEKLVRLTNNLHLACLDGEETARLFFKEAARETVNYVQYHFSTEEHMMLFLMYPGYPNHKKEHESFAREVLRQSQMFTEHRNLVPNRFVLFLKDWVMSHIAVCDRELAEYILNLEDKDKLEIFLSRQV